MFLNHLFGGVVGESVTFTPENPDGSPGGACKAEPEDLRPFGLSPAQAAKDLGRGWKVAPCVDIPPGEAWSLADIAGPGVVEHIWLTVNPLHLRDLRFAASFDNTDDAIDVPLGDFFCTVWKPIPVSGTAISVGTNGGLNCYLPMPFDSGAHLRVENQGDATVTIFYAVDCRVGARPSGPGRLHARFGSSEPVGEGLHRLLDLDGDVDGRYVGTFMAWEQTTDGWWGEGEVKFYMNGDTEFPTITSTGLEDYFGGAWCFCSGSFSAPHLGFTTVEGLNELSGARHTMYRFHLLDPIIFRSGLRVEVQALGWNQHETRYRLLQDNVTSVAYWYQ